MGCAQPPQPGPDDPPTHQRLLEELTVIDDPEPHPGALNMALDEVLLERLGSTPLLRCYRWSSQTVSLGCFGSIGPVRAGYPGVEWVRRWTGGGIVEHGDDFTYTLLVPRALAPATLPASECYRLIHGALASALAAAGWPAVEAARPASEPPDGVEPAPFLKPCFAHPVPYDLLAAGEKIAGGAQRRTRRGLLHQGSVQGTFFGAAERDSRWHRLEESLADALAPRCTHRAVTAAEIAGAHALAAGKYAAPAWTERF